MGIHVWTGGPSRRGRRMSLEFSLGRQMAFDPDYLRRHPEMFHPYPVPPFMTDGMHNKVSYFNEYFSK